MKTITTPLPVTADSVIDSDYNEQTPNKRRKQKPPTKRADHKHIYKKAWLKNTLMIHKATAHGVIQQPVEHTIPIEYCTECGRIQTLGWSVSGGLSYNDYVKRIEAGPQSGETVFREPFKEPDNYGTPRRVDLDNFYIQE